MSEKRNVTMDDALAAGDAVIMTAQRLRIEELERALQEIADYIKELEAQRDELLEALELVVSFVDAGEGTWTVEEQNKARAAIKKAKGECVTEKEHRQRTTGKDAVVREWVGLTDEEIEAAGHLNVEGERMLPYSFARAIEAKLREKNA